VDCSFDGPLLVSFLKGPLWPSAIHGRIFMMDPTNSATAQDKLPLEFILVGKIDVRLGWKAKQCID